MTSNGIYAVKKDRRARIKRLQDWLNRLDDYPDLETLLAKFCLEEGVSMHTVKYDYLKLLKVAGIIDKNIS